MFPSSLTSIPRCTALLIFLTLAVLFTFPIGDGDFFWHVKTGEWIWQHRSIPLHDPFSFTLGHLDPLKQETLRIQFILGQYWLGQLALYGIWKAMGDAGMVIFRCVAYIGLLGFLYFWVRKIRQGVVPLAAVLLTGNVLRNYPNERPQIFGFILMPALLFLLEHIRVREEKMHPFALVCLPLAMLLWSNCHGSFILGVVIVGLYLSSYLYQRLIAKKPLDKKVLAVLVLSILVSGLNPNGFDAFAAFLGVSHQYAQVVAELVSPLTLAWKYRIFDYAYWVMLVVTPVALIINFRKVAPAHLLVLLSLLGLSLTGVRYIPFFVLALPLVCHYLPDVTPRGKYSVLPLVIVLAWLVTADYRNVFKFRPERSFPAEAAQFLNTAKPSGNMFNYIVWGGYLLCYTPYPVFVDGRALAEDFVFLHDRVLAGIEWENILSRYNIQIMVFPGTQPIDGKAYPLLFQMLSNDRWALVHADDCALVFLKKGSVNDALIEKHLLSKETMSQHIQARWRWQLKGKF